MFAVFTSEPAVRQGPVWEFLTPWQPASRLAARVAAAKMALVIVLACLLVAGITAAFVISGHYGASYSGTNSPAVWGTAAYR